MNVVCSNDDGFKLYKCWSIVLRPPQVSWVIIPQTPKVSWDITPQTHKCTLESKPIAVFPANVTVDMPLLTVFGYRNSRHWRGVPHQLTECFPLYASGSEGRAKP